jgi:hypothetical protein
VDAFPIAHVRLLRQLFVLFRNHPISFLQQGPMIRSRGFRQHIHLVSPQIHLENSTMRLTVPSAFQPVRETRMVKGTTLTLFFASLRVCNDPRLDYFRLPSQLRQVYSEVDQTTLGGMADGTNQPLALGIKSISLEQGLILMAKPCSLIVWVLCLACQCQRPNKRRAILLSVTIRLFPESIRRLTLIAVVLRLVRHYLLLFMELLPLRTAPFSSMVALSKTMHFAATSLPICSRLAQAKQMNGEQPLAVFILLEQLLAHREHSRGLFLVFLSSGLTVHIYLYYCCARLIYLLYTFKFRCTYPWCKSS